MLEVVTVKNFCGFKSFTAPLRDFSLLIGPNNGGKTTVLRAIKFCIEGCRSLYYPQDQPHLDHVTRKDMRGPLQPVANACGITNLNSLYFDRDRIEPASVSLVIAGPDRLTIDVECGPGRDVIQGRFHFNDTVSYELSPDAVRDALRLLMSLRAEFVPPPATITPVEPVMDWQNLHSQIAAGRFAETWRNRLHWMSEGRESEAFQRVVNRVQRYMDGIEIRPPRRGKQQSHVEIIYVEDGVEHDIAAAGGGMRTLLTLAAAVELSDSSILLFDEPDSHLHSAVQRQVASFLQESASPDRQVIATSHAPDFIEECDIANSFWISRAERKARECDDIGRVLIDLGAVSHTQALAHVGADCLVCVEGRLDRRALGSVLRQCGKAGLLERMRVDKLRGYGNADRLPGVLAAMRAFRNLRIAIVAILDADFTEPDPRGSEEIRGGVLFLRLPCKELENLLLIADSSISAAVARAAERRRGFTQDEVRTPSEDEIKHKVRELSAAVDIRDTVKPQWMCSWAQRQKVNLNEPGSLQRVEEEFQKYWDRDEWRIRCCPGKEVLKRLRRWLQDEYHLTLTDGLLFDSYQPDAEMMRLIDACERHIVAEPRSL